MSCKHTHLKEWEQRLWNLVLVVFRPSLTIHDNYVCFLLHTTIIQNLGLNYQNLYENLKLVFTQDNVMKL